MFLCMKCRIIRKIFSFTLLLSTILLLLSGCIHISEKDKLMVKNNVSLPEYARVIFYLGDSFTNAINDDSRFEIDVYIDADDRKIGTLKSMDQMLAMDISPGNHSIEVLAPKSGNMRFEIPDMIPNIEPFIADVKFEADSTYAFKISFDRPHFLSQLFLILVTPFPEVDFRLFLIQDKNVEKIVKSHKLIRYVKKGE